MPVPEPAILQPGVLDGQRTPHAAAALWGGEPASVEHISTGASFTYRFVAGGRRLYLRLTPPGWQDLAALRAESTYIDALRTAGIAAAPPVVSLRGVLIEPVLDRGRELLAMAFEEAPGARSATGEWDEGRTRRFGRLLAQVHAGAPESLPPGQSRRGFDEELALTRAWLPETERELLAGLLAFERWAATLPCTHDVYGLVHNDLGEDNLLWVGNEPTLIDFDDCCFTWYAADIARTLGSLHDADPRRYQTLAAWCVQGYMQVRAPDPVTLAWLPRFVRFNAIAGLAWCLYSRSRGVYSQDAGEAAEAHLRAVIATPETWVKAMPGKG
jgi:Ser/Thr protein kinase RdoA (MazF antagonist)